jgi:hypothetical protein
MGATDPEDCGDDGREASAIQSGKVDKLEGQKSMFDGRRVVYDPECTIAYWTFVRRKQTISYSSRLLCLGGRVPVFGPCAAVSGGPVILLLFVTCS